MSSQMALSDQPRVLGDFEGAWHIRRRITPASGPGAVFEGEGIWTRIKGGCDYYETGVLRMTGTAPMRAERRYVWSDTLAVFFEDGRFFHDVPPMGGRCEHACAPDLYVVDYDFADWPAFHVRWSVRGPRKDYVSDSWYRRAQHP